MVVPNYIPDPIEIPDNVTEKPYRARLTYIRRVQALHVLSLGLVGAVAASPLPILPLGPVALGLLVFLIALCYVRIWFRGRRTEVVLSVAMSPVLLVFVGIFVRELWLAGVPVWAPLVGVGCAVVYAMLIGRDFSFVAQYLLSLIFSSTIIAGISILMRHEGLYAIEALILNLGYLTYCVYDNASLLSRRRLGEELAAVVDLYRDVLNVFGYVPRVVQHWHKHRIWQLR
ncbi:MAG: hypothetical protein QOJ65_562 [Fimbriimonadaceae bacterium]|jgi:hypothetical protein|nr:hypothetical protein [Fimbriimonadaceae bacterium]